MALVLTREAAVAAQLGTAISEIPTATPEPGFAD